LESDVVQPRSVFPVEPSKLDLGLDLSLLSKQNGYKTNQLINKKGSIMAAFNPLRRSVSSLIIKRQLFAAKATRSLTTSSQNIRTDLKVAHWLTAYYGMDELVWNHISARVDENHEAHPYLITPGTHHYMDLEEKDFVLIGATDGSNGVDLTNETGDVIHSAIYGARPDVRAIVHTHSPAVTAIACLKNGIQCYDQSSAPVYGSVAYYDWQGISSSHDEKSAIAAAATGKAQVLIMRNHGACAFGATVGEAWVRMYYLERACRLQLELMKCGGEINIPAKDLMVANAKTSTTELVPGTYEWEGMKRWVLKQWGNNNNNNDDDDDDDNIFVMRI